MRWTSEYPDVGDTRKRERFLWWPKAINGETRWLEKARWQEYYGQSLPDDHPESEGLEFPHMQSHWYAFRWLPLKENKPDPPYKPPTPRN